MLVMQFKIIPLADEVQDFGGNSGSGSPLGELGGVGSGSSVSSEELARPLLFMLIIQGIFSGLAIGKLSEGKIKAGIKHSFILTITAFLVATGAKLFL